MSENKDTGPQAGVKGVVEDVKGKAKEAAGAIAGKAELRREGRAQQDKAAAERDVAVKEAEPRRRAKLTRMRPSSAPTRANWRRVSEALARGRPR